MTRFVARLVVNILIVVVVLSAAISLIFDFNAYGTGGGVRPVFGLKFMTVLSDSMNPALRAGDIIVCRDKKIDDIKVGDIITYNIDDFFVTHRVVEKVSDGGEVLLKTRGDANNTVDGATIGAGQLIGALALRIPYGGYVIRFFKSIAGLILILIVPASLFIYGEIKTLLAAKEGKQDRKGGNRLVGSERRPKCMALVRRGVLNFFARDKKNKEMIK